MNSCLTSDIPAPAVLPAIGTFGNYVMPAIISEGRILAKETRTPVKVISHIGTFGLHLQELACERLRIETHFTAFESVYDYVAGIAKERETVEHWSAADEARYESAKRLIHGKL